MVETPPLPLHEDLQVAARRYLIRELPTDPSAMLRYEPLNRLHSTYATWKGRVPVGRPRRVHVSPELLANPARLDYSDGIAMLLRELIDGADLRPRVSTGIASAYVPHVPFPSNKNRRQQRHVDRLLAEWGLHHLHLGSQLRPRGDMRRSRFVLVAAFQPHDAYLINLIDHESNGANWSALDLAQTAVRNWPEAGVFTPSLYATGLVGGNMSDEDRRTLRNAGMSVGMFEYGGRVWSSASIGQMMDGTPARAANFCMGVDWQMRGWRDTGDGWHPGEDELRADLSRAAAEYGVPDEWRAVVWNDQYGFMSGTVFYPYGKLLPPS